MLAACRIETVIDEPTVFGFTYATLPDHPECGFESFTVTLSADGVTFDIEAISKPDALIMHPGPMNRGVEIDTAVADDIDRSLIHQQVEMGVAVRMACLEVLTAPGPNQ